MDVAPPEHQRLQRPGQHAHHQQEGRVQRQQEPAGVVDGRLGAAHAVASKRGHRAQLVGGVHRADQADGGGEQGAQAHETRRRQRPGDGREQQHVAVVVDDVGDVGEALPQRESPLAPPPLPDLAERAGGPGRAAREGHDRAAEASRSKRQWRPQAWTSRGPFQHQPQADDRRRDAGTGHHPRVLAGLVQPPPPEFLQQHGRRQDRRIEQHLGGEGWDRQPAGDPARRQQQHGHRHGDPDGEPGPGPLLAFGLALGRQDEGQHQIGPVEAEQHEVHAQRRAQGAEVGLGQHAGEAGHGDEVGRAQQRLVGHGEHPVRPGQGAQTLRYPGRARRKAWPRHGYPPEDQTYSTERKTHATSQSLKQRLFKVRIKRYVGAIKQVIA